MFNYEWKKLLHYRRGAILIAVFLVAELLGILLFTQPYDKVLEANREVYDRYLAQVEGPLTQEKRDYIETEMERLNTVHRQMEILKSDYYTGVVTEEGYRTGFGELVGDDSAYTGFAKLYSQYIFVRETDARSFLYTGGWEVLLGDQNPDYLFFLLLIFLLTPVFCQEYSSQMDQMLLTQKKSARSQWQTKVLAALVLTAILTAVLQLFRLVYCAIVFGLPSWDYSLQSIMSFGTTAKELTLWQAFLLQFVLKEVGYLYCAVVLLFFSVFFKKFNLSLMAGLAVLPLPFLTVNSNAVFLRIPGPWALTIGSMYLNPSVYYTDAMTGEQTVYFAEMTWGELGVLLASVAGILALMIVFIRAKNTNYHAKAKGRIIIAAATVVALLLSGCTGVQDEVIYNSNNASWFENEDYVIFSYGFGSSVLIDKQTGEIHDFPLSAYSGETAFAKGCFYEEDNKLYYLKTTELNPSGGSEATRSFAVIAELDLETLNESVYYQWAAERIWFFGLLELPQVEESPIYVREFFLHGNYIYYLRNGESYRMNRFTGVYEPYLDLPNVTNVAYDGQNVYYTDDYNRLVIRNLDSEEERTVEAVVADDFLLTPEGMYFLNRRDNNTLYYWDETAGEVCKLDDTPAYQLYWDENYLWLTASENMALYRMNHDGTDRTKLDCPGYICCIPSGDKLYMEDYETNSIYEVDKETLQVSVLIESIREQ